MYYSLVTHLGDGTMLAQLERRVGVAQGLEEGLDGVEEDLAVRGEDDVGNVAGRGPRLQGQRVPVVEGDGGDGQPLPLVAEGEGGDGQGLAAVIGVALRRHPRHPATNS